MLPQEHSECSCGYFYTTCHTRTINCGNPAGEIFDGSKRRLAPSWRSSAPRNVSPTPASEIENPMPAAQGPSGDLHRGQATSLTWFGAPVEKGLSLPIQRCSFNPGFHPCTARTGDPDPIISAR
ncbi:hypothetical protein BU25DRAFT_25423 [Macroventuria anomochaeta]|uniref:Uncharacterized protein n=1 Tax=Macroventuria anomochaeta TaxID=301207 RepID=A0ACB6S4B9_9PLEO|nr:uncharacterized protein BU25DRAFT_25423 [Macroventuria anomochaeta]KAF2629006.1 hypothetical protein BU25DRAFT_25423 [Macroventuria anomochaeta]